GQRLLQHRDLPLRGPPLFRDPQQYVIPLFPTRPGTAIPYASLYDAGHGREKQTTNAQQPTSSKSSRPPSGSALTSFSGASRPPLAPPPTTTRPSSSPASSSESSRPQSPPPSCSSAASGTRNPRPRPASPFGTWASDSARSSAVSCRLVSSMSRPT